MSKHSENRSIFDAIENDDVRAKAAASSHQGQQSAERPNCIFLTGGVQSCPAGRCGAGKQIWLYVHFRYMLMNSCGQCIDSVKVTSTIVQIVIKRMYNFYLKTESQTRNVLNVLCV